MMKTACLMSLVLVQLQSCLGFQKCVAFNYEMPIYANDDVKSINNRRTRLEVQQILNLSTSINMSTASCIFRADLTNDFGKTAGKLKQYSNDDFAGDCNQANKPCMHVHGLNSSASAIICCYRWDGHSQAQLLTIYLNAYKLEKQAEDDLWVLSLLRENEPTTKQTTMAKQQQETKESYDSNDVTAGIIVACLFAAAITLVLLVYVIMRRKRRNKINVNESYDPTGLGSSAETTPNPDSFFHSKSANETADDGSDFSAAKHEATEETEKDTEAEDKQTNASVTKKQADSVANTGQPPATTNKPEPVKNSAMDSVPESNLNPTPEQDAKTQTAIPDTDVNTNQDSSMMSVS